MTMMILNTQPDLARGRGASASAPGTPQASGAVYAAIFVRAGRTRAANGHPGSLFLCSARFVDLSFRHKFGRVRTWPVRPEIRSKVRLRTV